MRPFLLSLVSTAAAVLVVAATSVIILSACIISGKPDVSLVSSQTVDSLGACQGASYLDGKVYLYGDREVGMIREFDRKGASLHYTGKEIRLTADGKDVINHPTGIAKHGKLPVFIEKGEQVALNSVNIDKADELEGFTFTGTSSNGIAVTSSRKSNVHKVRVNW